MNSAIYSTPENFIIIKGEDIDVIYAALLSMVHENHSAQDNMNKAQWERAEDLFQKFYHVLTKENQNG